MPQIECDFTIFTRIKIDIMKVILFISTLILLTSCGKYDKPFISFQSPEKRLMDKTWSCSMAVAEDGTEFQVEDKITFTIDGTDSIFTRITTHWPLTPLYYTAGTRSGGFRYYCGYLDLGICDRR